MNLLASRLDARTRRVAVSSIAGAAHRVLAILATGLIFPTVLHTLGPVGFGIWGAAASLTMLVTVADFGIGPAIVNLVAHALASSRPASARDEYAAALIMALVMGVAVALVGSATTLLLAPRAARGAYLVAAAGLAINVPLGTANSTWLALQRGWMAIVADVIQTVVSMIGVFVAARLWPNTLVFVGAIYGSLLLANLASMSYLLRTVDGVRPKRLADGLPRLKAVFQTGGRFFALTGLDSLSYVFDTVLALQLLGAGASGEMAIVQRVCGASVGILLIVAQPLWPAFVDAAARGERAWVQKTLFRGVVLVSGAAIAGSAVLVIFGASLLHLWLGDAVKITPTLLWVMALWIVSFSLTRVQMLLLNALRIVGFQIAVLAVCTGLAFTLKLVLAPRLGLVGILLPTAVCFPLIVLPALLWRIGRWNDSHTQLTAA